VGPQRSQKSICIHIGIGGIYGDDKIIPFIVFMIFQVGSRHN
jgi:hypothetical protein